MNFSKKNELPVQIAEDSAQALYYKVLQSICKGEEVSSVKGDKTVGSAWGTRERPTKELRHATLILENPRDRLINAPIVSLKKIIARAVLATLSDEMQLSPLEFYDSRSVEFSDDGKTLPTNYGYRIRHLDEVDQIQMVINLLREDPNTRRAVIHIHSPKDLNRKYNPCIDSVHFSLRKGALECQTFWRSENALTLLPVNLFEFTMFQELVASELEVPVGRYVHTVTSLHYYVEDCERMRQNLVALEITKKPDIMERMPNGSLGQVAILREYEKKLRLREFFSPEDEGAKNLFEKLSTYWQNLGQIIACTIVEKSMLNRLAIIAR